MLWVNVMKELIKILNHKNVWNKRTFVKKKKVKYIFIDISIF